MITFATQEDFEKAVMQAINNFLAIDVEVSKDLGQAWGGASVETTEVRVHLIDSMSGQYISSAVDCE